MSNLGPYAVSPVKVSLAVIRRSAFDLISVDYSKKGRT